MAPADMTGLKRTLGLPGLTFFGVGMILGAGIYSVIGAAAAKTGESLWVAFIIGGLAALLTALSYAELAAMHPKAGAEFVYVREAFPRFKGLAAACGLTLVLATCATATTVALAFAGYLAELVEVPRMVIAFAVLTAATAVNVIGVRHSTIVTVIFTLIEVAGLALVIYLGATHEGFGRALLAAPDRGVLAGAALVFFAYLGFEEIANLAEEAKDPGKTLPRAIFISLGFTSMIYILVALAVVALAAPAALAATDSPLAYAVSRAWPRVAPVLAGIALFATANTALATMLTGSRMLFGMARDGELPATVARVIPDRRTPWVASLVVLAVAAALLPFGTIAIVAGVSSFGALLGFLLVNVCLIVLRRRAPDRKRPFRVPLAVGFVPVPAALGVAACLALLVSFEPHVYAAGGIAVALAVLVVATRRWWKR